MFLQPPGCVGSNMFRAFSQHFLHRMSITQDGPIRDEETGKAVIRVTLLQRGKPENSGVYRQISNQDELVGVLQQFKDFRVQVGHSSKSKSSSSCQTCIGKYIPTRMYFFGGGMRAEGTRKFLVFLAFFALKSHFWNSQKSGGVHIKKVASAKCCPLLYWVQFLVCIWI